MFISLSKVSFFLLLKTDAKRFIFCTRLNHFDETCGPFDILNEFYTFLLLKMIEFFFSIS